MNFSPRPLSAVCLGLSLSFAFAAASCRQADGGAGASAASAPAASVARASAIAADDDGGMPLSDYATTFASTPRALVAEDESVRLDDMSTTRPATFTELVGLNSPVRNQGHRGVCTMFSTVALMEHLYLKAGVVDPDFS